MNSLSMEVRCGGIRAWCNRCGSEDFRLVRPQEGLNAASLLACELCGARAVHGELIGQIGDEAVRLAQLAMLGLKLRHVQHRRRLTVLRACESALRIAVAEEAIRHCVA